jgi:hypothetical protein
VNLTSRLSHAPTTARPRPAELLGTHHPPVRDLAGLNAARTQSVTVGAALAGGVGALVAHSAAGLALMLPITIVARTSARLVNGSD